MVRIDSKQVVVLGKFPLPVEVIGFAEAIVSEKIAALGPPARRPVRINRMHKEIVIVGLNHRSASIDVRESVAFESSYVSDALRQLRAFPSLQEGVILSTCNRVEIVAVSSDRSRVFDDIKSFLAQQKPCRKSNNFEAHVYTHCGAEAVRHLFRVASSLDSMVVGEPQILGQLK